MNRVLNIALCLSTVILLAGCSSDSDSAPDTTPEGGVVDGKLCFVASITESTVTELSKTIFDSEYSFAWEACSDQVVCFSYDESGVLELWGDEGDDYHSYMSISNVDGRSAKLSSLLDYNGDESGSLLYLFSAVDSGNIELNGDEYTITFTLPATFDGSYSSLDEYTYMYARKRAGASVNSGVSFQPIPVALRFVVKNDTGEDHTIETLKFTASVADAIPSSISITQDREFSDNSTMYQSIVIDPNSDILLEDEESTELVAFLFKQYENDDPFWEQTFDIDVKFSGEGDYTKIRSEIPFYELKAYGGSTDNSLLSGYVYSFEVSIPISPTSTTISLSAISDEWTPSGDTWTIRSEESPSASDFDALESFIADIDPTRMITLIFPNIVTLPQGALYGITTSVERIEMPNATSLGDWSMKGITSLESVSMPSVTTISQQALQDCTSLAEIHFPAATSVGYRAFRNCQKLCSSAENNGTLSLPEVTSLEQDAFHSCYTVTSISIPKIEYINESAFYNLSNVTSIEAATESAKKLSVDELAFSNLKNTATQCRLTTNTEVSGTTISENVWSVAIYDDTNKVTLTFSSIIDKASATGDENNDANENTDEDSIPSMEGSGDLFVDNDTYTDGSEIDDMEIKDIEEED